MTAFANSNTGTWNNNGSLSLYSTSHLIALVNYVWQLFGLLSAFLVNPRQCQWKCASMASQFGHLDQVVSRIKAKLPVLFTLGRIVVQLSSN